MSFRRIVVAAILLYGNGKRGGWRVGSWFDWGAGVFGCLRVSGELGKKACEISVNLQDNP